MIANLFALEEQMEKIQAHRPPLQRLDEVIDWEFFRPWIEEPFRREAKGPGGRPPYDRILMFKILILQKYYNLSDEQTEFQIKDRLSFLNFLGLDLGEDVPDATTIWNFKETLGKAGILEDLFDRFTECLSSCGIVAKEGSIVDASFVEVPRQRNHREENRDIKQGAVPLAFGQKNERGRRDRLSQKDTDARWVKKNGERFYGYKNHINADRKTKLITRYRVTDASVHDSQVLEELIDERDQEAYGDSAYRSEKIEAFLQEKGCRSQIHEKGYKDHPLSEEQKESNRLKSKVRARVEHLFAFMTHSMKGLFNRRIGIRRNRFEIGLMNLVYNFCRYEQLVRIEKVERIW